jgi:hypothetical protein
VLLLFYLCGLGLGLGLGHSLNLVSLGDNWEGLGFRRLGLGFRVISRTACDGAVEQQVQFGFKFGLGVRVWRL